MKKIGVLFFVGLLLVSFAFAQSDLIKSSGLGDGIGKVKNVTDNVQKFSAEENKLDFLGNLWKELILKNRFVSAVDGFFKDVNIVFVILFGMSYVFSITMFFVFLIWLFVALSFSKYTFLFFKDGWQSLIVSVAGASVVAQTQMYNYLSIVIIKLLFYNKGIFWTMLNYLLVFAVFLGFYLINKIFGKRLRALKRLKRMRKVEQSEDQIVRVAKGIEKGASS